MIFEVNDVDEDEPFRVTSLYEYFCYVGGGDCCHYHHSTTTTATRCGGGDGCWYHHSPSGSTSLGTNTASL